MRNSERAISTVAMRYLAWDGEERAECVAEEGRRYLEEVQTPLSIRRVGEGRVGGDNPRQRAEGGVEDSLGTRRWLDHNGRRELRAPRASRKGDSTLRTRGSPAGAA